MKIPIRIIISIITALLSATLITISAVHGLWMLFTIFLIILIWTLYLIIKSYVVQLKKLNILLDAVENNDFSFHFPETKIDNYEAQINYIFNRMRKILSQTKSEIVEKEKYYSIILDKVSTGIIVIDKNGFVSQINEAALSLISLPVLTHINQLKKIDNSFTQIVKELTPGVTRKITLNTLYGDKTLTIESASIVINGNELKILAINDIESELEENEIDSWIKLTRVLTHEIMNGISPITSLSERLLNKSDINDPSRQSLEVINHTGSQLISFINSYRQVTKIPTPECQVFSLKDFLSIEITAMKSTTNLPIKFILNVEPIDLMIYADKNLIARIVLNLLKNAIQSLSHQKEPYIKIDAYEDKEEKVIIDFSNNGEKIPEEIAKQIFIPFFTTKANGSGIGLSISRQIMRQHNGTLKLSYSNQNETRFSMIFR
ncbi:MAG: ATP-binding protein [Bacteroidales bacterium]|nr:ATP-binding protein [Bacteroidales bacterium]